MQVSRECKDEKPYIALSYRARGMEEEVTIHPRYVKSFYLFLLALGIGFYIAWGIISMRYFSLNAQQAFLDAGLYAVLVLLIGFGVVGTLFYRHLERKKKD